MAERSTGVDSDVEEARTEKSLMSSVNCCVPDSSHVWRYATASTREMSTFGVAIGVSGVSGVGLSSQLSEMGMELSENVCCSISSETVARKEGLGLETGFSLSVAGKMILLNTQSINGL